MLRSLELDLVELPARAPLRAAVYTGLPSHADRAAGRVWWDPYGPRYQLDASGAVHYAGPFVEVPQALVPPHYLLLQIAELARRSRIVERAFALLEPEPWDLDRLVGLYASIVARSTEIVEARGADFYVLFWDDDSELSNAMLRELTGRGVETIRVSEAIPLHEREAVSIPLDGHPRSAANRLLAQLLARRMKPLAEHGAGVEASHQTPGGNP